MTDRKNYDLLRKSERGKAMVKRDVQELMSRYNLSQEDLASRLGVSGMTVYRWQTGKTLPKSRVVLRAIADLKTELAGRG